MTLAQLDALLALRKPQGARVINLEQLVCDEWSAVLVVTRQDSVSAEEQMRQRLEGETHGGRDALSTVGGVSEIDFAENTKEQMLAEVTHETEHSGEKSQQKLNVLSGITVRLAGDIADQLKAPQKTSDPNESMHAIYENLPELSMPRMRLKVLLWSLQIMCTDPVVNPSLAPTAFDYCAQTLPGHLSDVDVAGVSTDQKLQVVHYLLRILREEEIVKRWIKASGQGLTNDYLEKKGIQESFLSWFQSPEIRSGLSQADQQLFQCLALGHARIWLETDEVEDAGPEVVSGYFKFLNTYLEKVS